MSFSHMAAIYCIFHVVSCVVSLVVFLLSESDTLTKSRMIDIIDVVCKGSYLINEYAVNYGL